MPPKVKRGEIYWVDFNPARGTEQAGTRPALVVQNDRGNTWSSYTVVAAISSAPLPRVYPFTVPLEQGEGGLPQAGHVNCAQVFTIDQSRLLRRSGALDAVRMKQVDTALRYQLELY
ncbi:MAG: type II toxin-antitoxin system PemK/MazF family toxin [Proteobacteria bacterium]|nr:type II toxin-antitoxin system PemK/MazF family toxin [Pseudomonadota bacterium]